MTEPAAPPAPDPIAGIVSVLEDLLVRSRTGEIRALAWVAVLYTGNVLRSIEPGAGLDRHLLAAGIGDLNFTTFAEREAGYEERALPAPAETEKPA